jgi:O-antigen ligase
MTYAQFNEKSLLACRVFAVITGIAATMSTLITSLASVAMLVTWLFSGEIVASLKRAFAQPAGKMLLVFFAWLVLGTLYAPTGWSEKLTTLLSWKKLLYTFVLLGLFYQDHWKRLFIGSYFIVMTENVVVSTALWLLKLPIRYQEEAGIFMSNHSAQSLAFVAAILCGLFLWQQHLSSVKKSLLIASILLFLFNIFFISASRSGYLALPIALGFSLLCFYGWKKLPLIAGGLLVLLLGVVLTSSTVQQGIQLAVEQKTHYQVSKNPTSVGVRVVFAENTVELIKQRPLLGYGTSAFKTTYAPYAAQKYHDWRGEPSTDPHNQYLFIALENGAIGVLLFLAYIATAVYQGIKQPPFGVMAASFLLAITAVSLFSSNFKTFPEGFLLAFFLGILLARPTVHSSNSGDQMTSH